MQSKFSKFFFLSLSFWTADWHQYSIIYFKQKLFLFFFYFYALKCGSLSITFSTGCLLQFSQMFKILIKILKIWLLTNISFSE